MAPRFSHKLHGRWQTFAAQGSGSGSSRRFLGFEMVRLQAPSLAMIHLETVKLIALNFRPWGVHEFRARRGATDDVKPVHHLAGDRAQSM